MCVQRQRVSKGSVSKGNQGMPRLRLSRLDDAYGYNFFFDPPAGTGDPGWTRAGRKRHTQTVNNWSTRRHWPIPEMPRGELEIACS